jgi:hypothetical protein
MLSHLNTEAGLQATSFSIDIEQTIGTVFVQAIRAFASLGWKASPKSSNPDSRY